MKEQAEPIDGIERLFTMLTNNFLLRTPCQGSPHLISEVTQLQIRINLVVLSIVSVGSRSAAMWQKQLMRSCATGPPSFRGNPNTESTSSPVFFHMYRSINGLPELMEITLASRLED
jgi:hypothetical protein